MLQSRGVAESETTEWLNNTPEVMVFEVCLWDVIWSGRDGMGFLKQKNIYFWMHCAGSSLWCEGLLVAAWAFSRCSAWAPQLGGFSCFRAQVPEGSGFSSCGTQA